jgi:C4-dicarboxylate transporter, DctQ subunit
MKSLKHFLMRRAEDVLVLLAAGIFFAFVVQIVTRYAKVPAVWPHEVIIIGWLWLIFWGAAFFLKDRDQVKFDVIYNLFSAGTRRTLSIISSLTLVGMFLLSAPATFDFISFKGIRGTDHFRIPFSWVFSCYLIFLVGVVVHYSIRAWRLIKGETPEDIDAADAIASTAHHTADKKDLGA